MSRPLRIEYEGAWYHVMNRGRRYEKVFKDTSDYEMFVDLLKESIEMWDIKIAAYCLMPNHYHMLVQTPLANVARAMRHINGVYTQRFNKRHGGDGQLFRGRYKSILVDGNSYLLQLVRYIHRNPLKARLVDSLSKYTWSSHKGYLSTDDQWEWLNKEFIYKFLSKNKEEWIKRYRQFVSISEDDEATRILGRRKWPSVWGPQSFIDWVKGKYYEAKTDDEVPQSKALIPGRKEILDAVCGYYGVDEKTLYKSKRGFTNEPRNVSIYLMRRMRKEGLIEIGKQFRIDQYSSVSSIIERVKKLVKEDPDLEKRIGEVSLNIIKSQRQT
jgi:putative transposase